MVALTNIRMSTIALTALLSLAIVDRATAELKSNLTIEIKGLKSQKGELCLKLFTTSPGFPDNDEKAVKRQCFKIAENPLKLTLKGVSSGSYAVSVFQDMNGDRRLNRSSDGVPTEAYGFSNNPGTRQDLTRYGDCVFLLAGFSETIKIQLQYPTGNVLKK